jgi:hypothetical protein
MIPGYNQCHQQGRLISIDFPHSNRVVIPFKCHWNGRREKSTTPWLHCARGPIPEWVDQNIPQFTVSPSDAEAMISQLNLVTSCRKSRMLNDSDSQQFLDLFPLSSWSAVPQFSLFERRKIPHNYKIHRKQTQPPIRWLMIQPMFLILMMNC